jgi:signal peptidase I
MNEELGAQQPEQEAPPVSVQRRITNWMRDVVETILPALLIVLVVNVFLAQATRVEGQSMEPNIHDNQRLVVEKISYRLHLPERGDIVVLKPPKSRSLPLEQRIVSWFCTVLPLEDILECSMDTPDPLIKRVIALPGETIEIKNGYVYINGQVLEEPYLQQLTFGNVSSRVISPGHVFVLGDNRSASNDSRSFGEVALSNVVGRAWFRYWPPDEIGVVR